MSNTFQIGSVQLRYCREFFNEAYQNERSLEVALGRWFLSRAPVPLHGVTPPVIEVGCVLPYYGNDQHEIVDLTDEHPKNRKVNGLSLDYTGRNVLSISTIEHMNGREFGNKSDEDCTRFLAKVVKEATNYLVTWGVGYNPVLDQWVQDRPEVPRTIMKRMSWKNDYRQLAGVDCDKGGAAWQLPFGHSDRPIPPGYFNNANGVVVVTNLPELLSQQ